MYLYFEYIVGIVLFILICVGLYLFLPRRSEKIDLDKLTKSIGYNEDRLCNELVNIYKKYIAAIDRFDLDFLKKYCGYNVYGRNAGHLGMEKKRQHFIYKEDFELNSFKLIDIARAGNEVHVSMDINYSIYDYVLDGENKVIRGSKNKKKKFIKRLVFFRCFSNHLVSVCSNCGHKVDDDSNFCDNCHQQIRSLSGNWMLNVENDNGPIKRWLKRWK